MAYTTSTEYETAQSRISTLLDQIGEQIEAIATSSEGSTGIDRVIAEQNKSFFIFKQNELISAYRDRDVHDDRDSYIAKLEADIEKSKRQEDYYHDLWMKERRNNGNLKSALKSIAAVINED